MASPGILVSSIVSSVVQQYLLQVVRVLGKAREKGPFHHRGLYLFNLHIFIPDRAVDWLTPLHCLYHLVAMLVQVCWEKEQSR